LEILTPLQKKLLNAVGKSDLKGDFYLTGGTALSAFYLKHRISEDLDFFTGTPKRVAIALPSVKEIAEVLGLELEVVREFDTYIEVVLSDESGATVRCDFAQDSPYRLAEPVFEEEYGIYVDSLVDICCNKLSALFDRAEPKDFVDVFFLAKEYKPFAEMVNTAKKKHIGFDEYWLAVALGQAAKIEVLPSMVKTLSLEEMKVFFEERAAEIGDSLEKKGE
jgi:predicted nucleotidyltransferase component of viral defense system